MQSVCEDGGCVVVVRVVSILSGSRAPRPPRPARPPRPHILHNFQSQTLRVNEVSNFEEASYEESPLH